MYSFPLVDLLAQSLVFTIRQPTPDGLLCCVHPHLSRIKVSVCVCPDAQQAIITTIMDAQAAAAGGAAGRVRFGQGLPSLQMDQPVVLAGGCLMWHALHSSDAMLSSGNNGAKVVQHACDPHTKQWVNTVKQQGLQSTFDRSTSTFQHHDECPSAAAPTQSCGATSVHSCSWQPRSCLRACKMRRRPGACSLITCGTMCQVPAQPLWGEPMFQGVGDNPDGPLSDTYCQ